MARGPRGGAGVLLVRVLFFDCLEKSSLLLCFLSSRVIRCVYNMNEYWIGGREDDDDDDGLETAARRVRRRFRLFLLLLLFDIRRGKKMSDILYIIGTR